MLNLFALIAEATKTPLTTAVLVFGIVVIVMAVFLIIAVLMQQGKQHNLSGTIAGAADTFFGKTKGQAINNKLSILTSVVSIIFVLVVLFFNFTRVENENIFGKKAAETTAAAVESTDADTTEDTTADTTEGTEADTTESADADATEESTDAAAEDTNVEAAEDSVEGGGADLDEIADETTQNADETQN